MKKTIKWLLIFGGVLGILLLCFMAGYVDGIFTGTARGIMTSSFKIIPTAHAIHLKPVPATIDLLDRNLEEMALELKPLQSHLGKLDSKTLDDLKSLLNRYIGDHPNAIKDAEVLKWLGNK